MMKFIQTCLLFSLLGLNSFAQSITGDLSQLANQEIKLQGFNGLKTYAIASANADAQGKFSLKYTPTDFGMGFLIASDNQPYFVLLNGENMILKGNSLSDVDNLTVAGGKENQQFNEYIKTFPKREQALSAWNYLEMLYKNNTFFHNRRKTLHAIQQEIQHIQREEKALMNRLSKDSYISWYLPIRDLVTSVPATVQQRPNEIPQVISAFRKLNYADNRLYKSGLLKDLIESHFWLISNSSRDKDEVLKQMKASIDSLLPTLAQNEKSYNDVTNHLFELLEKYSFFDASEYLAIKALNETSCTIDKDLAKHLETYRAMKKGNTAKDIDLSGLSFRNGEPQTEYSKLSDIKKPYTLVVFGAGWCPKCNEELPKIVQNYNKWAAKGVEVVFVSLDTDKEAFQKATKTYPFISTCDFKKWQSAAAQDYYVFATPTIYLLDSTRKILLRPTSVEQIDTFLEEKNNH